MMAAKVGEPLLCAPIWKYPGQENITNQYLKATFTRNLEIKFILESNRGKAKICVIKQLILKTEVTLKVYTVIVY